MLLFLAAWFAALGLQGQSSANRPALITSGAEVSVGTDRPVFGSFSGRFAAGRDGALLAGFAYNSIGHRSRDFTLAYRWLLWPADGRSRLVPWIEAGGRYGLTRAQNPYGVRVDMGLASTSPSGWTLGVAFPVVAWHRWPAVADGDIVRSFVKTRWNDAAIFTAALTIGGERIASSALARKCNPASGGGYLLFDGGFSSQRDITSAGNRIRYAFRSRWRARAGLGYGRPLIRHTLGAAAYISWEPAWNSPQGAAYSTEVAGNAIGWRGGLRLDAFIGRSALQPSIGLRTEYVVVSLSPGRLFGTSYVHEWGHQQYGQLAISAGFWLVGGEFWGVLAGLDVLAVTLSGFGGGFYDPRMGVGHLTLVWRRAG